MQCFSIIVRQIGNKLAPFLPKIVPELVRLSKDLNEEESKEQGNELSETALSTLESIVRKCPLHVNAYIDDLLSMAFRLCEYDPNYIYPEGDEDEEMNEDEDEGGWGSDDDFEEQSDVDDGDDTSWKVRRASFTLIDAVIRTRPDLAKKIIHTYSDKLIDRVKERTDDVKEEVLKTFQGVIRVSMEVRDTSVDTELKNQQSIVR